MREIACNELLNSKQVAKMLGISYRTLAVWRSTQRYDLAYIKIGERVRYRAKDVVDFIDSMEVKDE